MNDLNIIIDGDSTPWRFEEKEEDRTCIVKNINNGELFEGVIDSITSRGIYIIKIINKVNI